MKINFVLMNFERTLHWTNQNPATVYGLLVNLSRHSIFANSF
jgi:hypothetical protein